MESLIDHDHCEQRARDIIAETLASALDLHITTEPPLTVGDYEPLGMKCPHGVTFWAEPTGEQIAEWVRTQTP